MTISTKVQGAIERSSWIRRMFEEGAALVAQNGAENVFDFTLGNPSVEPPKAFQDELRRLANLPDIGTHRYMNNAGYEETRAAVTEHIAEMSGIPVHRITSYNVCYTKLLRHSPGRSSR